MLKVSNNSFTKSTKTTGSGSFSSGTDVPESTNSFAKKTIKKGATAWEGQNTSDAGLGDDLLSPETQGVNEAGGFRHFQNRNQPQISH